MVWFIPPVATMVKQARKAYKISDEDRARRAAQITGFASIGGQANVEKHGFDGLSKAGKLGGTARSKNYQFLKMIIQPESPEGIRKRRMELEAKREQILDALVESAEADGAEVSVVSAALRELRTEADRLIDREARAKAEQAVQAAAGPARAALVPAIPPAILPALVAADPAPGPPSICAD
jgi:hypothetical protein